MKHPGQARNRLWWEARGCEDTPSQHGDRVPWSIESSLKSAEILTHWRYRLSHPIDSCVELAYCCDSKMQPWDGCCIVLVQKLLDQQYWFWLHGHQYEFCMNQMQQRILRCNRVPIKMLSLPSWSIVRLGLKWLAAWHISFWILCPDCQNSLIQSWNGRSQAAWWACTTASSTSLWRLSLWKPEIRRRNTGHGRAVGKTHNFFSIRLSEYHI